MKHLFILLALSLSISLQAQDFDFGKVSKAELQETEHPLDKDADAAILYKEEKSKFGYLQGEGFQIITDVFYRIKIYNNKGFKWGNHVIELNKLNGTKEKISGFKAVTYNLEGNKIEETKLKRDGRFEEEKSDYVILEKFTMPNLKEGSVIEFKYTFTSQFFFNINPIKLQQTIPINKLNVVFESPEYFNYKPLNRGYLPINASTSESFDQVQLVYKSRANGYKGTGGTSYDRETVEFKTTIYTIDSENVPAISTEAYSGNINNYLSSLNFELEYTRFPNEVAKTYSTTWEEVAKTIYESTAFGIQIERTGFFKNNLEKVLAGTQGDQEKVFAIYNHLRVKMNWNNYLGYTTKDGVRAAYKAGVGSVGDINLLLVAMLRDANLDANPVLVSTVNNGIPSYPATSSFNYVIASVNIDGNTYLMDATRKNAAIGTLDEDILNWKGRLIRDNGESQWVDLYPSSLSTTSNVMQLSLNDDLKVSGLNKSKYSGMFAYNLVNTVPLNNTSEVEKHLANTYPTIETNSHEVTDKGIGNTVELQFNIEALKGAEEIGGKFYLNPLGHLAQEENPFKLEAREYPIVFNFPRKTSSILSITIPEGFVVESLPESMGVSLPENLGKYIFRVNNAGNTIQIYSETIINAPIIAPILYPELKTFFNKILEKEKENIVLVKV